MDIDLNNLTEEERDAILSVLRRDEDLKARETERVRNLKAEVKRLRMRGVIKDGQDASKSCARCRQSFGWFFNKGSVCPNCQHRVCDKCKETVDADGWLCVLCFKQMELKAMTGSWFYNKFRKSKRNMKTNQVVSGGELVRASIRRRPRHGVASNSLTEEVKRALTNNNAPPRSPRAHHGNRDGESSDTQSMEGMSPGRKSADGRNAAFPQDEDKQMLMELIRPMRTGVNGPGSGSNPLQSGNQQQPNVIQVKKVSSHRYQDSDSDSDSAPSSPQLSSRNESMFAHTDSLRSSIRSSGVSSDGRMTMVTDMGGVSDMELASVDIPYSQMHGQQGSPSAQTAPRAAHVTLPSELMINEEVGRTRSRSPSPTAHKGGGHPQGVGGTAKTRSRQHQQQQQQQRDPSRQDRTQQQKRQQQQQQPHRSHSGGRTSGSAAGSAAGHMGAEESSSDAQSPVVSPQTAPARRAAPGHYGGDPLTGSRSQGGGKFRKLDQRGGVDQRAVVSSDPRHVHPASSRDGDVIVTTTPVLAGTGRAPWPRGQAPAPPSPPPAPPSAPLLLSKRSDSVQAQPASLAGASGNAPFAPGTSSTGDGSSASGGVRREKISSTAPARKAHRVESSGPVRSRKVGAWLGTDGGEDGRSVSSGAPSQGGDGGEGGEEGPVDYPEATPPTPTAHRPGGASKNAAEEDSDVSGGGGGVDSDSGDGSDGGGDNAVAISNAQGQTQKQGAHNIQKKLRENEKLQRVSYVRSQPNDIPQGMDVDFVDEGDPWAVSGTVTLSKSATDAQRTSLPKDGGDANKHRHREGQGDGQREAHAHAKASHGSQGEGQSEQPYRPPRFNPFNKEGHFEERGNEEDHVYQAPPWDPFNETSSDVSGYVGDEDEKDAQSSSLEDLEWDNEVRVTAPSHPAPPPHPPPRTDSRRTAGTTRDAPQASSSPTRTSAAAARGATGGADEVGPNQELEHRMKQKALRELRSVFIANLSEERHLTEEQEEELEALALSELLAEEDLEDETDYLGFPGRSSPLYDNEAGLNYSDSAQGMRAERRTEGGSDRQEFGPYSSEYQAYMAAALATMRKARYGRVLPNTSDEEDSLSIISEQTEPLDSATDPQSSAGTVTRESDSQGDLSDELSSSYAEPHEESPVESRMAAEKPVQQTGAAASDNSATTTLTAQNTEALQRRKRIKEKLGLLQNSRPGSSKAAKSEDEIPTEDYEDRSSVFGESVASPAHPIRDPGPPDDGVPKEHVEVAVKAIIGDTAAAEPQWREQKRRPLQRLDTMSLVEENTVSGQVPVSDLDDDLDDILEMNRRFVSDSDMAELMQKPEIRDVMKPPEVVTDRRSEGQRQAHGPKDVRRNSADGKKISSKLKVSTTSRKGSEGVRQSSVDQKRAQGTESAPTHPVEVPHKSARAESNKATRPADLPSRRSLDSNLPVKKSQKVSRRSLRAAEDNLVDTSPVKSVSDLTRAFDKPPPYMNLKASKDTSDADEDMDHDHSPRGTAPLHETGAKSLRGSHAPPSTSQEAPAEEEDESILHEDSLLSPTRSDIPQAGTPVTTEVAVMKEVPISTATEAFHLSQESTDWRRGKKRVLPHSGSGLATDHVTTRSPSVGSADTVLMILSEAKPERSKKRSAGVDLQEPDSLPVDMQSSGVKIQRVQPDAESAMQMGEYPNRGVPAPDTRPDRDVEDVGITQSGEFTPVCQSMVVDQEREDPSAVHKSGPGIPANPEQHVDACGGESESNSTGSSRVSDDKSQNVSGTQCLGSDLDTRLDASGEGLAKVSSYEDVYRHHSITNEHPDDEGLLIPDNSATRRPSLRKSSEFKSDDRSGRDRSALDHRATDAVHEGSLLAKQNQGIERWVFVEEKFYPDGQTKSEVNPDFAGLKPTAGGLQDADEGESGDVFSLERSSDVVDLGTVGAASGARPKVGTRDRNFSGHSTGARDGKISDTGPHVVSHGAADSGRSGVVRSESMASTKSLGSSISSLMSDSLASLSSSSDDEDEEEDETPALKSQTTVVIVHKKGPHPLHDNDATVTLDSLSLTRESHSYQSLNVLLDDDLDTAEIRAHPESFDQEFSSDPDDLNLNLRVGESGDIVDPELEGWERGAGDVWDIPTLPPSKPPRSRSGFKPGMSPESVEPAFIKSHPDLDEPQFSEPDSADREVPEVPALITEHHLPEPISSSSDLHYNLPTGVNSIPLTQSVACPLVDVDSVVAREALETVKEQSTEDGDFGDHGDHGAVGLRDSGIGEDKESLRLLVSSSIETEEGEGQSDTSTTPRAADRPDLGPTPSHFPDNPQRLAQEDLSDLIDSQSPSGGPSASVSVATHSRPNSPLDLDHDPDLDLRHASGSDSDSDDVRSDGRRSTGDRHSSEKSAPADDDVTTDSQSASGAGLEVTLASGADPDPDSPDGAAAANGLLTPSSGQSHGEGAPSGEREDSSPQGRRSLTASAGGPPSPSGRASPRGKAAQDRASGGDTTSISSKNSVPSIAVSASAKEPASSKEPKSVAGAQPDAEDYENIDELFASHGSRVGHQSPSASLHSRTGSNLLTPFSASRESIASYYSDAGEGHYGNIPVSGEVLFGLDYNYKTNTFEIHIKQCRDLAPVDVKRRRSDPYIKTYLLPDRTKNGKRKTRVKKHTLNPTFEETLRYNLTKSELENRSLWITVWNNDSFGRNDFLGEINIAMDNYSFNDPTPRWHVLEERVVPAPSENANPMSKLTYKGDLVVSLKFVTSEQVISKKRTKGSKRGELHVLVKEARNLTAVRANGTSDPFCKGYLLPERTKHTKQKTIVKKKDCNPKWNHTFVFEDISWDDLKERGLELTIWDHDRFTSNDFLGGVRLCLGTGKSAEKVVDWMDSKGEEISIWQSMLDRPNSWIEGTLLLRPHMDTRQ